ncbi:Gmad2 immunoglobulin-like domain-containing protein [Hamadaea tsunoensis]|uniref:Gmad2 immunoglobulin-like domain-containing protein n=1 Tax=Hamadaea tsunoensis TaxID=53368 RepID=UPI0004035ED6|nr:Gmad2 immunoglobulin-like domain-containing protein [Hamadaea tsunoensis]
MTGRRLTAALLAVALGATACSPKSGTLSATQGPSQSATQGAEGAVPVYYGIDDAGTQKLVREYHSSDKTGAEDKASFAVSEMLDQNAVDPEYHSLWPEGSQLAGLSISGDTTTVDITGGETPEPIALQELAWTVTAVTGKPKVQLKDGPLLTRASAVDTLYPVWVISPQEGDQVGGDVRIHLAGIVFEATINYDVLSGAQVVKHDVVHLDKGAPDQGEATLTLHLDAGSYVIEAYEVSQKDGSRQHVDTHSFTVG